MTTLGFVDWRRSEITAMAAPTPQGYLQATLTPRLRDGSAGAEDHGLLHVTLRSAARAALIDALSARVNRSDSGIVARIAGDAIGADNFLPNMGTEDFLSCLSRPALEGSCKDTSVLPRQRVKDTRAALVEHFKEGHFVHPSALFAPDAASLSAWLSSNAVAANDDEEDEQDAGDAPTEELADDEADEFLEAAE